MKHYRYQQGFSLIEVIFFITVSSLLIATIATMFGDAYSKSPNHSYNQQAMALASQRMELIMLEKQKQGFKQFVDPCQVSIPPAVCLGVTGFTVQSSISSNWQGDANYKIIKIKVSGQANVSLQAMVASY